MARRRASQSREQREAARETARLETRNRRANFRDQQLDNFQRARRDYPSPYSDRVLRKILPGPVPGPATRLFAGTVSTDDISQSNCNAITSSICNIFRYDFE
ncbi:hypothetical protein J6590_073862 [Homalodisca vitripennis]|nr:hypothetical protein J6590_073862 [Homalodisca vitripennis]